MYFLFAIIILFFLFLFANHVVIDWKSLFKRGFSKNDDKFGLYCYTGKQGKGKTYGVVNFICSNSFTKNYKVLTNVKSFAERNDFTYYDNMSTIISYCKQNYKNEKILIFFDEIFTLLNKHTPLNKEILSFLSQLRKRKIIFVTTAQEWAEINMTFRRYVRFQVSCNMFNIPIINKAFIFNKINDGENIMWSEIDQTYIAPTIESHFGKANLCIANRYDTLETIKTSDRI